MGILIRFPQERCRAPSADADGRHGSATIIILPAVRRERHGDTGPAAAAEPRAAQRSRRRAAVRPAP